MRTDLRSSNLPITEALRAYLTQRLELATRRFACRVERVILRLDDVAGPSGVSVVRCRVMSHLSPSGCVLVEATGRDVYSASSIAAVRLGERLARATEERRPRRWSSRRGGARRSIRERSVVIIHRTAVRNYQA